MARRLLAPLKGLGVDPSDVEEQVPVPLGFLLGTFAAMAIAASAERSSPSAEDLFNRKELAFVGLLLPVLVVLVGSRAVGAVRNWLG